MPTWGTLISNTITISEDNILDNTSEKRIQMLSWSKPRAREETKWIKEKKLEEEEEGKLEVMNHNEGNNKWWRRQKDLNMKNSCSIKLNN